MPFERRPRCARQENFFGRFISLRASLVQPGHFSGFYVSQSMVSDA